MIVKPIKKIETIACMGILDTDPGSIIPTTIVALHFGLEKFLKRIVVAKIS